jgi:glycosyltransferase involved in cell wall biosynthesis
MLINVLIPVYNTDPMVIDECLDSIYRQTFRDWRVFIMNDKSTNEHTVDYLNSINDNKVRVFHLDENMGGEHARLCGKNYIEDDCRYVAFMDSDDVMMPKRFEKQVKFLDSNRDVGTVGTQMQKFYPPNIHHPQIGNINPENCYTSHPFDVNKFILKKHWCVNNPSTMMCKEVVKNFDVDIITRLQDEAKIPSNTFGDFIFHCINSIKGVKIRNLSDILLFYRVSSPQLTRGETYNQSNHKRLRKIIWNKYVC